MALFVDGPVSTHRRPDHQDSGLLEVARDLRNRCHDETVAGARRTRDGSPALAGPAASDAGNGFGPILHIEQVVVTPQLKRWGTMQALSMFYRDAYFSQLVDRYQARWDEYSRLTRDAYEKFVASGLGIVLNPVRKHLFRCWAPLRGRNRAVPSTQA